MRAPRERQGQVLLCSPRQRPTLLLSSQLPLPLTASAKALRGHTSDAKNGAKVVAACIEKALHAIEYAVDVYMDRKRYATCSSSAVKKKTVTALPYTKVPSMIGSLDTGKPFEEP